MRDAIKNLACDFYYWRHERRHLNTRDAFDTYAQTSVGKARMDDLGVQQAERTWTPEAEAHLDQQVALLAELEKREARIAELEGQLPQPAVPEGWGVSRSAEGEIQLDSPEGNHCLVIRIDEAPEHHPLNMLESMCRAVLAAPQPPKEGE